MAADNREVLRTRSRALAGIQAHRRIERVKIQPAWWRNIKSATGKANKEVREGDAACIDKSRNQKINVLNLMSLIIQS